MRACRAFAASLLTVALVALAPPAHPSGAGDPQATAATQPPAAAPRTGPAQPVFRGGTQLVSVDVIVRDGSGAVVRGLTAGDFEVTEDGKPQEIRSFAFEEINDQSRRGRNGGSARRRAGEAGRATRKAQTPAPAARHLRPRRCAGKPMTLAGSWPDAG